MNDGGFANQTAMGTWTLQVARTISGTTGTLNRWTLAVCVDTSTTSVCGNGTVEAAETCDDANATAGDGCAACQLELTCPAGNPVFVRGAGLPLSIPDGNPAGVTTLASVAATGTVTKAIVAIGTITHHWLSDLQLSLISPAGISIELSSSNGSNGDDLVSTIFDDAATASIVGAAAPSRGRFAPQSPLSAVDGQFANGTWRLKVVDAFARDPGTIVSWTLGLCVQ